MVVEAGRGGDLVMLDDPPERVAQIAERRAVGMDDPLAAAVESIGELEAPAVPALVGVGPGQPAKAVIAVGDLGHMQITVGNAAE
jgi:hypothetical protein